MSSNNINFKFVILGVVILMIGILAIQLLTIDDNLVSLLYNIPDKINPFENAPQATLDYMAVTSKKVTVPNLFTTCEFKNRIYYIDSTNTKRLIGSKIIDPTPFMKASITTEQTNRAVKTFTGEITGSCKVKSGFESLVPTIDSGYVNLVITGTKSDGTTVQVYSKTTQLTLKGKNLSSGLTLFTFDVPASEIESKLSLKSSSYKSFLKIKPNMVLTIYFKGDKPTNQWTVGGQTEASLRVLVNNDKFNCSLSCASNNKEIKVVINKPTNGELTLKDRRLSFSVVLPEWSETQGSPSFSIKYELGLLVTPNIKMALSKSDGESGVFTKDILLPAIEGEFTLEVSQQGRDTEQRTVKIVKEKTVTGGTEGNDEETEPEPEGCDADQKEYDIAGVIICAPDSPLVELIMNNLGLVVVGIFIFMIILAVISRKSG